MAGLHELVDGVLEVETSELKVAEPKDELVVRIMSVNQLSRADARALVEAGYMRLGRYIEIFDTGSSCQWAAHR